jgi:purine-binding chemotaxis protein CheW
MVVAARGRLIGLLADAVQQVIHLDLDRIQPPPDDVLTVQSDYIRGVYHLDDNLVLLLDVERALVVREGPEESRSSSAASSAAASST